MVKAGQVPAQASLQWNFSQYSWRYCGKSGAIFCAAGIGQQILGKSHPGTPREVQGLARSILCRSKVLAPRGHHISSQRALQPAALNFPRRYAGKARRGTR